MLVDAGRRWSTVGPAGALGPAHHGGVHPSRPGQPSREERLDRALQRDGAACIWCGRSFSPLVVPTTDHLVPRVKGGPSWQENEVAACRRCNGQRGHASPADWLLECRGRGWCPDVEAVAGVLRSLAAAIGERGGQRRARPYLAAQIRRVDRLLGR